MSHLRKLSVVLSACCAIAMTVAGCGRGNEELADAASPGCPDSGAKVFVTAQGAVTVNGRQVDPSQFKDALLALSPAPTVVCYSRENPAGEPHPASQSVVEAIISAQLPVGFFTDETFQTPITPQ